MMRNARLVFLILAGAMVIAASDAITAQAPSDPSLVYIHATAFERKGRPVIGLLSDEFKVFEDNVPQDIAFFSGKNAPITVEILLDVEDTNKDRVKTAATTGLISGTPGDEIDVAETGKARLNDAVYQGIDKLVHGRNDTRALILFTTRNDPGDGSFSKVKELLRHQDVRLYVVGLPTRADLASDQSRPMLKELAEVNGGTAFFPASIIEVQDIFRKIGKELRNQYLIGYHPTNAATDGKWRKIKVNAQHADKGNVVKFDIHTRTGYYSQK